MNIEKSKKVCRENAVHEDTSKYMVSGADVHLLEPPPLEPVPDVEREVEAYEKGGVENEEPALEVVLRAGD